MLKGIVDTNIVIYFSRGLTDGEWLRKELDTHAKEFGISVITEAELFAKSHLEPEERMMLDQCLLEFTIIPVDSTIARWGALYRARYQMRLGDALIAATARTLDLPLWTYNVKDFQKIQGVVIKQPDVTLEEQQ